MAAAMQWVSRIMAAGLMMVLPGLAGQWLDGRLGTSFLVLVGFAAGIWIAIAYLIAITKNETSSGENSSGENNSGENNSGIAITKNKNSSGKKPPGQKGK